jgi:4Fe-4S ferredoxin
MLINRYACANLLDQRVCKTSLTLAVPQAQPTGVEMMREVLLGTKDDRSQVYLPELCIGCGTCVKTCPKGELIIGSVGAVSRGLIDKDFLEKKNRACTLCALCAKVCPTGALDFRKAGKSERDDSYLSVAMKPTAVDHGKCVRCGLCIDLCPQGCLSRDGWKLAEDGCLGVVGKVRIDLARCVHCGWCSAACPTGAIAVEKPFSGEFSRDEAVCQACRTCVDTCPANALFNKEWKPGEIVEKVSHRKDACIYCGACSVACPVGAITVDKTAILPEMKKKNVFEKMVSGPSPRPSLTSRLETDDNRCLGCGNCVIACPVNAFSDPYLAAGHLNELDKKALLEVTNGSIKIVNQDVCGSCATCSMICPADAIWLVKKEVA